MTGSVAFWRSQPQKCMAMHERGGGYYHATTLSFASAVPSCIALCLPCCAELRCDVLCCAAAGTDECGGLMQDSEGMARASPRKHVPGSVSLHAPLPRYPHAGLFPNCPASKLLPVCPASAAPAVWFLPRPWRLAPTPKAEAPNIPERLGFFSHPPCHPILAAGGYLPDPHAEADSC